ncbi:MAG: hypothetical protein QOD53_771 [Thermoleophilaceae bacterium]|nr:hypothetical protein [Thermoleophilaceae bacterium]
MRLAVVWTLVLSFVVLPAGAQASIEVTSTAGAYPFSGPPPATLVITTTTAATLVLEHSGSTYTLTATSGGSIFAGPSTSENLQDACTGFMSNVVTCPDTEVPGVHEVPEAPYGIYVDRQAGSMFFTLKNQGSLANPQLFPAASIKVVATGADPITASNETKTDMTVLGGDGGDTFHPGAGNDTFDGGGGSGDTVSYDNPFGPSGRCAVVSLDGVANDTMRAGGCATGTPGPVLETDNIRADVVNGSPNADNITGSNAAETLNGGAGNDLLSGGGGADSLHADADGATMIGGPGADNFFSSPGSGTVSYIDKTAAVNTTFDGNPDGEVDVSPAPGNQSEGDNIPDSISTVIGGSGQDTLSAAAATNAHTLDGGPNNDAIIGGPGNDRLAGGSGNDTLTDGSASSDDTFVPGPGNDTYSDSGGSGNPIPAGDRLDYGDDTGGVQLSMDGLANDGEPGSTENVPASFEILAGGSGGDQITGNGNAQFLIGSGGDDVLDARGGNDILSAGVIAGDCDTIKPGTGDDTIQDVLPGPGCRDLIDYSVNHPNAVQIAVGDGSSTQDIDPTGTIENETFLGTNVDFLGTPLADTIDVSASAVPHKLFGGAGTNIIDTLTGGSANDTLVGGTGNDVLNGGGGNDVSSYEDRSADIVADIGPNPDGDPLLSEADQFTSIESLTGGGGADTLTGDGGANTLTGGNGADTLVGLAGIDTLSGGQGVDNLDGGADGDTLDGGTEGDTLSGGADGDTLTGGAGVDQLNGDAGADTLSGGDDGDTLDGGADSDPAINGDGGDDVLRGGTGADVVDGGLGTDRLDEGSAANGSDTLTGGGGTDTTDYGGRTNAVTVSLNGAADDGETGPPAENDNVATENVTGGAGNDVLTGDAGVNVFKAGLGNDTLNSRDSVADTDDCGAGTDVANADSKDVPVQCETVNLPKLPPPPPPVKPTASAVAVPATVKAAKLLKGGLSMALTTAPAGATVTARLLIDKKTAKKAHLGKGKKPVVVGTATGVSTTPSGNIVLKVKLTKKAKKKLKKLKKYTLTTEITVTSAGGSLTITRKTKVKRK